MMMRCFHKMIVLSLCVLVLPAFLFSCKKSLGDRWVDSTDKIELYADASETSPVVTRIPGGEKVEALQEKPGKLNPAVKWTEVRWNGMTGWTWNTSLSLTQPAQQAPQAESSFPAETIIPLPELEAAAKEFYEARLMKELAGKTEGEINETINRLREFGYKVKYRIGDFAVVKTGASFLGPATDIITHADALWQKKDGKWSQSQTLPLGEKGEKLYLYQMNNDELPDVLMMRNVSDSCTLTVYLGKSDGTFQQVGAPGSDEGISFDDIGGTVMKIGKCGGTSIEAPEGEGRIVITFDCAKNMLVKTKK